MTSKPTQTPVRISDLRRAHVADGTLENLLNVLGTKMQTCSRLTVFEYEAGSEGHPAAAAAFRALGRAERESFHELLACLRQYLDEMPDLQLRRRPPEES